MNQRAHTFARCTATLLAVLWLCQPLSALLHARDEHAHRFCPQHQTFEETALGTGARIARVALEQGAQISALPEAATDSAALTHEECPLVTSSSRPELLSPYHPSLVLTLLAVSRPATAPPQVHPPLAILDTAPKASPPARA
ncbi:hypothetical protein [Myxococcus sp. Y35]|uniref:hypothetical protein n=1 Tax=Pseudomyxococcus flavus TaxID=3115648 RepID=UPI003CF678CB